MRITPADDRRIGLAIAAQILAIPYQDAHRLLLTGRLTGRKVGGRWFVDRDSLEALRHEYRISRAESEPNDPEQTDE